MNPKEPCVYEFGAYSLNAAEGLLFRDGKMVPLPTKVFDTLLALVQRSGHVLSKSELLETLWPGQFIEESALAQNIFQLRKVLGERRERQFVETVHKRGYRFISGVKKVHTGNGNGEAGPALSLDSEDDKVRLRLGAKTLAVLPFRHLNPKSDDRLLGLPLADAIIIKLNNIGLISALPTSSIYKHVDRGLDALTIGRRLGAGAVLDGTVLQSADRTRVTWQLIRLHDGVVLCSGKLDEQYSDVFTLQDSIAEHIAKELILNLGGTNQRSASQHYTDSADAYQHYIKGRFFWDQRTASGLQKSIEYFQRAISIDPDYAIAHSGLADSYSFLGEFLYSNPVDVSLQVKLAAERAVSVGYTLAETHASLAEYRFVYERNWAGSEEEFKLALKLDPNHAATRHLFGWLLLTQQRYSEAANEFNLARDLDRLSLVYNTAVGLPFLYERQYHRAIRQFKQTLEMNQGHIIANYHLGLALLFKGDYEEALAAFAKVYVAEYTPHLTALIGYTYAVSGERRAALRELRRLQALSTKTYVSPVSLAVVYSGLGEIDKALDCLEKAYWERTAWVIFLNIEPAFDRLRSHYRFTDLLGRLGFVAR